MPSDTAARGPSPRLIALASVALAAVPLVVALAALREPHWYPVGDLAFAELRVRDVASSHPPLIGAHSGASGLGEQASHLGPLSFWMLWPVYALFGRTAWALQAATVTAHLAAIAIVLWIAQRRGGRVLVLAIGVLVAVYVYGFGAAVLTQPWNPYLPAVWWFVYLLAIWSVLCGDFLLIPLAVFAGSFCVQSHFSYLGLVLGLGVFVGLVLAFPHSRSGNRETQHGLKPWALAGLVVAVLVWLPPVVEEFANSPGNLSILWDFFTGPGDAHVGTGRGVELFLANLDPTRLLSGDAVESFDANGSWIPGSVVVCMWVGLVVLSRRRRCRPLARLNLLVGTVLVLGAVSMGLIVGFVHFWLTLWTWGVLALLVLAIGWSVAFLVEGALEDPVRSRVSLAAGLLLLSAALVTSFVLAVEARRVEFENPAVATALGRVSGRTIDALSNGEAPGGGRAGTYVVTGFAFEGLINELERAGFEAGAPARHRTIVRPHRVVEPSEATAGVHLVVDVGSAVEVLEAAPGVVCIARLGGQSVRELGEYERLRREVVRGLDRAGRTDLVGLVDGNLALALRDELPKAIRARGERMLEIGIPIAVCVGPPGSLDAG